MSQIPESSVFRQPLYHKPKIPISMHGNLISYFGHPSPNLKPAGMLEMWIPWFGNLPEQILTMADTPR